MTSDSDRYWWSKMTIHNDGNQVSSVTTVLITARYLWENYSRSYDPVRAL